jgi:FAD/FMN-containing dehydrogenase
MVWNAVKPDRFPDAIVRVQSEADIRNAVRFARQRHLKVGIRGGGHNWHNAALRQGGLLLDLSGLNQLEVHADRGTAVVQPGVTGAKLMADLSSRGLAFPIANGGQVAMSGFLLNGGLGRNCRKWGPSCASVEAVDIVDARGESIHADQSRDPELFWAARGAGPGFFGIATRFYLKVLPLPRAILSSTLTYQLEDLDEVSGWLPLFVKSVPAHVHSGCRIVVTRDNARRVEVFALAFAETVSDSRKALEAFATAPLGLKVVRKNLDQELSVEDAFGSVTPEGDGPRYAGDSGWSDASPSALLSAVRPAMLTAPPGSVVNLNFVESRGWPKQPDMAFSMFASTYVHVHALWNAAADDRANQDWVRTTCRSLEPLKVGHYVGEADLTVAPDRARRCFSASAWNKLSQLKRRYDPDDVFFSYLQ